MSIFEEALKFGIQFYSDPEQLTEDMIDPLLWPAVQRINRSGFCWTAESCQGHPDDNDTTIVGGPWAGNVQPMLRLVCRLEGLGRMLDCWVRAMVVHLPITNDPVDAGHLSAKQLSFDCHPYKVGVFCELLFYIHTRTVGDRNIGIMAIDQFARLVTPN